MMKTFTSLTIGNTTHTLELPASTFELTGNQYYINLIITYEDWRMGIKLNWLNIKYASRKKRGKDYYYCCSQNDQFFYRYRII